MAPDLEIGLAESTEPLGGFRLTLAIPDARDWNYFALEEVTVE